VPFDAAPSEADSSSSAEAEAAATAEPPAAVSAVSAVSAEEAQPAADAADLSDPADRSDPDDGRPRPRSPRPNGSGSAPRPGPPTQHRPSPADLADLAGSFALTAGVQDPEPQPPVAATTDQHRDQHRDQQHDPRFDDPAGERGLRGLVGGGSSQVNVTAAMRARDASRPTDDDVALAEAELPIVRRGWVPRDELPRPH
jgi:hypothetical protein